MAGYPSLAQATAAVLAAEQAVTEAKKVATAVVVRELRAGSEVVNLAKPHSPWTAAHIRTVAGDYGIELTSAKKRQFVTAARPAKPAPELPAVAQDLTLAAATAAVAAAERTRDEAKKLATAAVVRQLRAGQQPVDLKKPASPWSTTHIRGIADDHGIELQESKKRPGPRGSYKKPAAQEAHDGR